MSAFASNAEALFSWGCVDVSQCHSRRTVHTTLCPAVSNLEESRDAWGRYNYRADVAYDGTAYKGYQLQRGHSAAPTIQGELERCIGLALQEGRDTLRMQAAGRTDAGVHARGQVINFYSNDSGVPPSKVLGAANSLLPADIRITAFARVPPDFSARYSALGKEYEYNLLAAPVHDPLEIRFCHHVRQPLDLERVRAAAAVFVGRHDFMQFANVAPVERDTVKTLTRCEVEDRGGGRLRFHVAGSGFLWKMVRHMVAAAIEVGRGSLPLERIGELLSVGNAVVPGRSYRGWPVAAAKGLVLARVAYPPHADPGTLLHPRLRHDAWGRVDASFGENGMRGDWRPDLL